jgi:flagellar hook-associated protein 2
MAASMSTGTTTVDGIISGINTTDILDQLAAIKKKPITALQTQQTTLQKNLTTYQSLSAQILGLKTYADALTVDSTFSARQTSSSDTSTVIASAKVRGVDRQLQRKC